MVNILRKQDEPDGLILRRKVEIMILELVVNHDDLLNIWVISAMRYRNNTLDGVNHTRYGWFIKLIKESGLMNATQLRAVEASALRIIGFWKKGNFDGIDKEQKFWENMPDLSYGELTPKMREIVSEYETNKRRRKAYRKRIVANHEPVTVRRL